MIQLFVTLKGRSIGRFDPTGDRARIGRHADNEVQIDSLAISRFHCVITRDQAEDTWWLEDLGSHNGTQLNGFPIRSKLQVRDGDAIGVGQFQITVRIGAARPDAATVYQSNSPEVREQSAPARAYLTPIGTQGPAVLIERDVLTFGARPEADVSLPHAPLIALIARGYGGFQLLNATADPRAVSLDGAPVPHRAWLDAGATLAIYDRSFRFQTGLPPNDQRTLAMPLPKPSP